MIYGNFILKYLKDKFLKEDPQSSSHWQFFHQFLEIDNNLNIKQTLGFGDGKKKYKLLADLIHRIFQFPLIFLEKKSSYFYRLYKIGRENTFYTGNHFSLDALRQVFTLNYLKKKELILKHRICIVIGDGFGSLTSLLLRSELSEKVIMVNLTKTLFVDVASILAFPEFSNNYAIVLVRSKREMEEAISNTSVKVIALEAQNYHLLSASKAELAFNIASMQEMDMVNIENYFKQFRNLAKQKQFYFYCCNRDSKILPDGSEICFDKYPWSSNDKHFFDEKCPWHTHYYTIRPPFYKKYDGPIKHRFTLVSENKNDKEIFKK